MKKLSHRALRMEIAGKKLPVPDTIDRNILRGSASVHAGPVDQLRRRFLQDPEGGFQKRRMNMIGDTVGDLIPSAVIQQLQQAEGGLSQHPFVRVFPNALLQGKMLIQQLNVVKQNAGEKPVGVQGPQAGAVAGLPVHEEVLRLCFTDQENVIIKVDKLLRQIP